MRTSTSGEGEAADATGRIDMSGWPGGWASDVRVHAAASAASAMARIRPRNLPPPVAESIPFGLSVPHRPLWPRWYPSSSVDQSQPKRDVDGLSPVVGSQLLEDALEMRFHCVRRDAEMTGNLLGGVAVGDVLKDHGCAVGER